MKTFFSMLMLFAAIAAPSQTATTATDNQTSGNSAPQQGNQHLLLMPEKANEIRSDRITCDGILVELWKGANPLQLINPAAPPAYGSSLDNVVLSPISSQPSGLNFFSIHF